MGLLGKIMVKLGLDSSEFTKGAKDAESTTESFGDKIKGMAVKAAAAIGVLSLLKKAFDFGKEAYNTAARAEGVERAFAKLNNPNLLNELRNATQGTVSDLELMQRAVEAKNFKIPLDNLATYLKFASQRAKDTGQSVDYLVNSIVVGVGRKSPLILDNLGISAREVSDEFKKTGDMAKAVSTIIEREMGSANDTLVDSKEKIGQASSAWSNAVKEFGKIKTIKDIGDAFKSASAEIGNFITEASKAAQLPNLNGLQSLWAFLNPSYANSKTLEFNVEENKKNAAKLEEQARYVNLFLEGSNYTAENIEKALKRIGSIDVSGLYWYDEDTAGRVKNSMEDDLKKMKELEKQAKKDADIRENSRQGIKAQIEELQSLADVETDTKKLKALDAEIAALEKRLKIGKETVDVFKKGSLGYMEQQKADLEKKIKLTVDDDERRKLLKEVEDINIIIKIKTKFEPAVSEREQLEKQIKQLENAQLEIPISIGKEQAQSDFNWLQGQINILKEALKAFPKIQEVVPIKGSLDWYDAEIKKITDSLGGLTGDELSAKQAALALLEVQRQGLESGYKNELQIETDKLNALKIAYEQATESMKAHYAEKIKAQEAVVAGVTGADVALKNAEKISEQFSQVLAETAISSIQTLADSLVGLSDASPEQAVSAILMPLADMAIAAGTLILTTGTAVEALKDSLTSFFGGSAIAAGIALVGIGIAAKAGLGALAKSGAKNASNSANPNTFTGGYSNSVGSSTRTAQSLQLASPQPQVVVLETKVSGSDIVFAANKEEQRKKR